MTISTLPETARAEPGLIERLAGKVRRRLGAGLYHTETYLGLRRDLAVDFPLMKARIPISLREVEPTDIPVLFPADQSHLDPADRQELAWRMTHLEADIPTCYVAVDERNGEPCYIQWLMDWRQNARIKAMWPDMPTFREGEGLLENAYCPPHYRGKGVAARAPGLILEKAKEQGLRYVYTFVGTDNRGSIRGCQRAGLMPHTIRRQTRALFGFIERSTYEPLAGDDPRRAGVYENGVMP